MNLLSVMRAKGTRSAAQDAATQVVADGGVPWLLGDQPERRKEPVVIVEIEVLPRPAGTPEDPYRHVESAIAAIAAAGVVHEVGALGTTFEAPADAAWEVTRAAHDACLASGAESVVTIVKLAQSAGDTGPTIAGLTGKFRG